jgi:hypothetical protein
MTNFDAPKSIKFDFTSDRRAKQANVVLNGSFIYRFRINYAYTSFPIQFHFKPAIIMVAVFKLYWSIPRFNDYWMAVCNYDDDDGNYFSGGYCC